MVDSIDLGGGGGGGHTPETPGVMPVEGSGGGGHTPAAPETMDLSGVDAHDDNTRRVTLSGVDDTGPLHLNMLTFERAVGDLKSAPIFRLEMAPSFDLSGLTGGTSEEDLEVRIHLASENFAFPSVPPTDALQDALARIIMASPNLESGTIYMAAATVITADLQAAMTAKGITQA